MSETKTPTDARPFTLGEYRVGTTFNPGGHEGVNWFKSNVASFIDECKRLQDASANPEAKRCFAEAMTCAETAAMYAVKGVTKPDKPENL